MSQTLTLETTVIQRETGRTAEILFVPASSLALAGLGSAGLREDLGLQIGVPIQTADDLQDLLFASLAGRRYPFDESSFARWRPQRLDVPGSLDAVFAAQLATSDLVPISSSPIHGVSLTTLLGQGAAWTLASAEGVFQDPLHGLGVLILAEAGLTIAAVARGARETLVIAVKYRLRQRLGIPPDWMPPEDHERRR